MKFNLPPFKVASLHRELADICDELSQYTKKIADDPNNSLSKTEEIERQKLNDRYVKITTELNAAVVI